MTSSNSSSVVLVKVESASSGEQDTSRFVEVSDSGEQFSVEHKTILTTVQKIPYKNSPPP